MNNQEILQKAIEKAVENGWNDKEWVIENIDYSAWTNGNFENVIIFSHDFAKALFGESNEIKCNSCGYIKSRTNLGWKYHLKQMVVSEDPIKYLEQYL